MDRQSDLSKLPRKLWEHPTPSRTRMWQFMEKCNSKWSLDMKNFQELYQWSVGLSRNDFWTALWKEFSLIYEGSYSRPVDLLAEMDTIPRWFTGIKMNFAENMLYSPGKKKGSTATQEKKDNQIAVTEVREGCEEIKNYTWGELRRKVGLLSNAMRKHGVRNGDRIAVVASNSVDTLCVFLAVSALGGIFSSSSTDMGTQGVLDRLKQVKPVYVFVDDAVLYNGTRADLRGKMRDILDGLDGVGKFKGVVSCPRFHRAKDVSSLPRTMTLATYLEAANERVELQFERVPFHDPLVIVYSSGTTGVPKCIVHSVGGAVSSFLKEAVIHRDMNASTVVLQYSTTAWIMYLTSVFGLMVGARVILYDGSPLRPNLKTFIKLVGDEEVTHLGISPRYMQELQKQGVAPRDVTNLYALKHVISTGMVLKDELFEWFYDTGFPSHAQLANISGGTDIAGCFGMDNPLTPVYVGGCQGPSLGTAIAVYGQQENGGQDKKGIKLEDGIAGELVATKSFPNQPASFWGIDGSEKYHNSYFANFKNVWTHGDFVMIHPITKQIFFLGRADGVLNPSGVRFGSAEIYNVIEKFVPQVLDSICVGQRRAQDHDETVLLFVNMSPGHKFNQIIVKTIKEAIARELSKRHVPKHVFETPEIPTTINQKKVELPVKQIVSGFTIKPSNTLANPSCLQFYYQFADIEKILAQQKYKSRL